MAIFFLDERRHILRYEFVYVNVELEGIFLLHAHVS